MKKEQVSGTRAFGRWLGRILGFALGCIFWQTNWQIEMLRSSYEAADNTRRIANNTRRDQWSDN